MEKCILNFSSLPGDLFTGRKNGLRAREQFRVPSLNSDVYELIARDDQLITSSFFLGLLSDDLKRFGTPENILKRVKLDKVSKASQDECVKAIKRGLTVRSGLV
jgi:hypothetical protein